MLSFLHPVLLPASVCVVVIVPLYGVLLLNGQVKRWATSVSFTDLLLIGLSIFSLVCSEDLSCHS